MTITTCAICAYPITEQHHIVPRAYGGGDEPDNLAPLCPNHHTGFHIVFRQYEWECRSQGYLGAFDRILNPLPAQHHTQYAVVSCDVALMDFFRRELIPRFEAAGFPFHVPQQRAAFAVMAEIATDNALHQEQLAWNAQKSTEATL